MHTHSNPIAIASLSHRHPSLCAGQAELKQLASISITHKFKKGKQIWESPFYLVLEGEISVVDERDASNVLCTRGA